MASIKQIEGQHVEEGEKGQVVNEAYRVSQQIEDRRMAIAYTYKG